MLPSMKMSLASFLGILAFLCVPRTAHADGVGVCSSATVAIIAGTSCTIGPVEFTFGQPSGFLSDLSFTPVITPLSAGTTGVGFELGPATLVADEGDDLTYTATILPNANSFIIGDLFGIYGSVYFPPGSYEVGADVADTMLICPPNFSGPPCVYAGASVNTFNLTSASTQEFFAYPYGAQSSVDGFIDVACQGDAPLTCQTGAEEFSVVIQESEPSTGMLLILGLSILVLARIANRTEKVAILNAGNVH